MIFIVDFAREEWKDCQDDARPASAAPLAIADPTLPPVASEKPPMRRPAHESDRRCQ